MEIFFCEACGNRITEGDLAEGSAVEVGPAKYCGECLRRRPELKSIAATVRRPFQPRPAKPPSGKAPARRRAPADSGRRVGAGPPKGPPMAIVAALSGLILTVAAGLALFGAGRSSGRASRGGASDGGAAADVRPVPGPGTSVATATPPPNAEDARVWGDRRVTASTAADAGHGTGAGPTVSPAATVQAPATSPGGVRRGAPPDGLAAYYSCDEGKGNRLADGSGNGRHGTISGARWGAGKCGWALEFDGRAGVVKLGKWNPSGTAGAFSFVAWVKAGGPTDSTRAIAAKRDGYDARKMMWQLVLPANRDSLALLRPDGETYFFHGPPVDAWAHLAVAFDGSKATVYVDGFRRDSEDASLGYGTDAEVTLGGFADGDGHFYGSIDEVYLYARALSWEDVLALMNLAQ